MDVPTSGMKALCRRIAACGPSESTTRCVDQLGASPDAIPAVYSYLTQVEGNELEQLSSKELIEAQRLDPVISVVMSQVKLGKCDPAPKHPNADVALLQRESSKLRIKCDLLYRVIKRPSGREVSQLILPAQYKSMVLKSMHDDIGHLGIERTTELVRNRFYGPKMASEIATYIQNCGRCVARKSLPHRAAPMQQIMSNGPLDLVCMDFLSIEPDSKGIANVLVITGHYTKVCSGIPDKRSKGPHRG